MKNCIFILLLLFLSQSRHCYPQYLPEIVIPEKPTSTYEKLISTYFIKNTKRLGLSGNVKAIKETQTKKSAFEVRAFVNDTCYYVKYRLEKSLLQLP